MLKNYLFVIILLLITPNYSAQEILIGETDYIETCSGTFHDKRR